jgi:peroxiredoxin
MSNILSAGTPAPDFTLHVTPDQMLSLKELRGRPVILAFYPVDWSPVCGDQMALYNETLPEFHRLNAELMGISVDGVWCHAAFSRDHKLHFPLLADFEPKGAVSKLYGAFRDGEGFSKRSRVFRSEVVMATLKVPVGPADHLQGPADNSINVFN